MAEIFRPKPSRQVMGKVNNSRIKYLKYCPLCAAEDIDSYGEAYWHRRHQLPEMFYCIKHETRLVDSSALLEGSSMKLYPASSAVNPQYATDIPDNLAPYKDKLLKIGCECDWLITHGFDVEWSVNGYEKYCRLLRDKGLASIKGYCNNHNALDKSFLEYWGSDFLDVLFDNLSIVRFESWYRKFDKIGVDNFSPLYHILVMCWLAGSVSEFVNSNPAETVFGHPPFVCENRICPHYHKDGAKMVDMVDYGQGYTAHFECSYCGMRYKHKKSTGSREQRIIVDYGHLWDCELRRCCQDPKITNEQAMEILKCPFSTLQLQKQKRGLITSMALHDTEIGADKYYKTQVDNICQEYEEVTIALLDEKVPGAYTYLQRRDYDWIRSRVVFDNERHFRLEREELLFNKLHEVIAAFDADGYPDRVLSYGYIAGLIGATRDELRYKMSPNSELRAFLDEIVEHKATWRQERAARMRKTNLGQGRVARKRPTNVPKRINTCKSYSQRVGLLLSKLREVIATFETEGYPDRRLSYNLLANLVGSTMGELKYKAEVCPDLKVYLDEIVERKGDWRNERAAKNGNCCSIYEKQIKHAIDKIWANPPQEQISRNHIAKVAGLGIDVLKDNPYLTKLTKDFVETRTEWHIRRLTTAYHNKPVEGRPYSTGEIRCAASIDYKTYNKHRKLFVEIVNNLNREATQDNV